MTTAKRRAPNPEWVQMYRQGISSSRIAAGAGAASSTVRYHLHLAVQADPGLPAAHKAARGSVTRQTPAGQRNLADVLAFHKAEGRLPATSGKTPRERALGAWVHRRRQDAAAGTLSPAYRTALSFIPGWEVVANQKADNEARWHQRIAELVEYRSAGNDWPRHKGFATEKERVLGVWLHVQRISARDGALRTDREVQLEAQLTGWRQGRERSGGRRQNGT